MSTTDIAALKPIGESNRILTIDVIRGVALLGVFAMNIIVFSMPYGAYLNPTVITEYEGADKWVYLVVHTIFDMKMMTLFSMLFGVGLMVYAEKLNRGAELATVRRLWFRRMFILLGIGVFHAYFIWEGDILVSYAVCGIVFLWWMRRLPAWAMIAIAVPMCIPPMLAQWVNGMSYDWFVEGNAPDFITEGMTAEEIQEASDKITKDLDPTPEQYEQAKAVHTGGYGGLFVYRLKMVLQMQFFMIPLFMIWRGTAMMLVGAALYKMRIITGERTTRFYLVLTAVSYLIGFAFTFAGIAYNESHGFSIVELMKYGIQFNMVGSIPMALGHMGLIILITRAMPMNFIVRALSSVGRMALTNYLAHAVIGSLIFYGYGLSRYGTMSRLELQMVVVGVWIAQLFWSPLWLKYYRFGPVEWAWRSLTYSKAQPMRRAA